MAKKERKKAKTSKPGEILLSPRWEIISLLEKHINEAIEAGSWFIKQPKNPELSYEIYQTALQQARKCFFLFISYGYKSLGLEYACIERQNIEAYLAKRSPHILEKGIGERDISEKI